ncbi:hypothetical protein FOZ61_005442 [Perkinsus olseni]|uniref:Uncharacterized protein n=1 Tax=Perkinsus olseni TaxID=32597 RepID=A0A7J6MD51_PEROL|nr:hypothetical protein FOZ61_005442 [Perkinsus olseni]
MRGRRLLIQTGLGVSVAIHLSRERTSALDGNAAVNFQCAENHCNPELVACLNDHEGPEANGPEGGKGNRCSEVIRCVYGKQTLDLSESRAVDYHQCFAGQKMHGETPPYGILKNCIATKNCAKGR